MKNAIGCVNNSRGFVQILLTIVLIVLAGGIGFSIYLIKEQEKTIKTLSQRLETVEKRLPKIEKIEKDTSSIMEELQKQKEKGLVNLTIPAVQKLDKDFMVAKLSVKPHLTGVMVKGTIINGTPLPQENIKFRLTILDKSKEFSIKKLSPGGSKAFEVYLPDVPPDKAQTARIEHLESTVLYYKD